MRCLIHKHVLAKKCLLLLAVNPLLSVVCFFFPKAYILSYSFFIMCFRLPGIQINFLLFLCCKNCEETSPSSTFSLLFISQSHLGTKIGQMGALLNGCGRAIQEVYLYFSMESTDIHRIIFLDLFLGFASCPLFFTVREHFTAPESFLPVI